MIDLPCPYLIIKSIWVKAFLLWALSVEIEIDNWTSTDMNHAEENGFGCDIFTEKLSSIKFDLINMKPVVELTLNSIWQCHLYVLLFWSSLRQSKANISCTLANALVTSFRNWFLHTFKVLSTWKLKHLISRP